MGINKFINAALDGKPVVVFGDGEQIRDFTFVADVVSATARAGEATDVAPGAVMNIAGGSACTVNELLHLIAQKIGSAVDTEHVEAQAGDVDRTGGDITRAGQLLGWAPRVALTTGIAEQVAWHRRTRDVQWLAQVPVPGQRGVEISAEVAAE